jgi:hypothetical protein
MEIKYIKIIYQVIVLKAEAALVKALTSIRKEICGV